MTGHLFLDTRKIVNYVTIPFFITAPSPSMNIEMSPYVIKMLSPVIKLLSQKFIIRHKSNGAIHERWDVDS